MLLLAYGSHFSNLLISLWQLENPPARTGSGPSRKVCMYIQIEELESEIRIKKITAALISSSIAFQLASILPNWFPGFILHLITIFSHPLFMLTRCHKKIRWIMFYSELSIFLCTVEEQSSTTILLLL